MKSLLFYRGVVMFRAGLTKGIYKSFLSTHRMNKTELESAPFVFVDPTNGNMKLLTSLFSSKEHGGEIYAFATANGGDVEVLSTEIN